MVTVVYVVFAMCVCVDGCLSHNPSMHTMFLGSWIHSRSSNPSHSPRHHEPLDSPDGLPGGYDWHPYREGHTETLPVGSTVYGGQTLGVWVWIFFTLQTMIWPIHQPSYHSDNWWIKNRKILFLGLSMYKAAGQFLDHIYYLSFQMSRFILTVGLNKMQPLLSCHLVTTTSDCLTHLKAICSLSSSLWTPRGIMRIPSGPFGHPLEPICSFQALYPSLIQCTTVWPWRMIELQYMTRQNLNVVNISMSLYFVSSYTWFVPMKWIKSGVEKQPYWLLQKTGMTMTNILFPVVAL